MKKFSIFIAAFLLMFHGLRAQNQKGDQTLGVSLGFSFNGSNYIYQDTNTGISSFGNSQAESFSTNPAYSYFIVNNLDIGASIGFGTGTSTGNYSNQSVNTKQADKAYYSSVYLRKYYLYSNKIGIRTGPYFSYQYLNQKTVDIPADQQNSSYSYRNYHAGIMADFVYYPSAKVGLAINLGNLSYNHGKYGSPQQNTSGDGVNLQLLNNNLMLSAFYVFGN